MPANHCQPHSAEAKAKMRAARLGKPAPWKHRHSQVVNGVLLFECGRCHQLLPRDAFYANKRTLLGLKSECKACHTKSAMASRDPENTRRLRRESMARVRASDVEAARERDRIASRNRPKTLRTEARVLLNSAVRAGKVLRAASCEGCGASGRLHGHHDDYSKPLQVRWLCPPCHGKEHRK